MKLLLINNLEAFLSVVSLTWFHYIKLFNADFHDDFIMIFFIKLINHITEFLNININYGDIYGIFIFLPFLLMIFSYILGFSIKKIISLFISELTETRYKFKGNIPMGYLYIIVIIAYMGPLLIFRLNIFPVIMIGIINTILVLFNLKILFPRFNKAI